MKRAIAEKLPVLERNLLLSLLPRDSADERGVIVEVRAGTGGDEASLFAGEIFRMYERYSASQGWRFEVAEYAASDVGGCKLASATVVVTQPMRMATLDRDALAQLTRSLPEIGRAVDNAFNRSLAVKVMRMNESSVRGAGRAEAGA